MCLILCVFVTCDVMIGLALWLSCISLSKTMTLLINVYSLDDTSKFTDKPTRGQSSRRLVNSFSLFLRYVYYVYDVSNAQ